MGEDETSTEETNIEETTNEEANNNDGSNEENNNDNQQPNNDVMSVISELSSKLDNAIGMITKLQGRVANFVEMGGVIREDDNIDNQEEQEKNKFVPIEELDLNL